MEDNGIGIAAREQKRNLAMLWGAIERRELVTLRRDKVVAGHRHRIDAAARISDAPYPRRGKRLRAHIFQCQVIDRRSGEEECADAVKLRVVGGYGIRCGADRLHPTEHAVRMDGRDECSPAALGRRAVFRFRQKP